MDFTDLIQGIGWTIFAYSPPFFASIAVLDSLSSQVLVFDAVTLKLRLTLQAHNLPLLQCSEYLIVAHGGNLILVWDGNGRLLGRIEEPIGIEEVVVQEATVAYTLGCGMGIKLVDFGQAKPKTSNDQSHHHPQQQQQSHTEEAQRRRVFYFPRRQGLAKQGKWTHTGNDLKILSMGQQQQQDPQGGPSPSALIDHGPIILYGVPLSTGAELNNSDPPSSTSPLMFYNPATKRTRPVNAPGEGKRVLVYTEDASVGAFRLEQGVEGLPVLTASPPQNAAPLTGPSKQATWTATKSLLALQASPCTLHILQHGLLASIITLQHPITTVSWHPTQARLLLTCAGSVSLYGWSPTGASIIKLPFDAELRFVPTSVQWSGVEEANCALVGGSVQMPAPTTTGLGVGARRPAGKNQQQHAPLATGGMASPGGWYVHVGAFCVAML